MEFISLGLGKCSELIEALGECSNSGMVIFGGNGKVGQCGDKGWTLVFRENGLMAVVISNVAGPECLAVLCLEGHLSQVVTQAQCRLRDQAVLYVGISEIVLERIQCLLGSRAALPICTGNWDHPCCQDQKKCDINILGFAIRLAISENLAHAIINLREHSINGVLCVIWGLILFIYHIM
jgi:hypothetical protein